MTPPATPTSEALAPLPSDPEQALQPYDPAAGHGGWDARHAAHLLRRAVGGGRTDEIADVVERGPEAALDGLFVPRSPEQEALWERLGAGAERTGDIDDLAAWWLLKLVQDRRAPGTRLVLFWHDHFACAQSKVDDVAAMRAQHQLFVERGEGPFEPLLLGVLRDVAMLRFLDGDSNRRGSPNENLAREVLELFSLGVGHYGEDDIQEGARALTGCTVRDGRFAYLPEHHDPEPKTVLGETIDGADDLGRVAVAQPACPRFLIDKLWRWYVSPRPPEAAVELLADRWREHDLETAWLLRTLLASRAFHSRDAYRSLVKSPVDYAVGVLRTLPGRPDYRAVARACADMGQTLFEPPGVQGWKDGEAWIHAAAWIARSNFAAQVAGGDEAFTRDVPVGELFPMSQRAGPAVIRRALDLFLQGDLGEARRESLVAELSRAGSVDLPVAVQSVLCLPEAHLA